MAALLPSACGHRRHLGDRLEGMQDTRSFEKVLDEAYNAIQGQRRADQDADDEGQGHGRDGLMSHYCYAFSMWLNIPDGEGRHKYHLAMLLVQRL